MTREQQTPRTCETNGHIFGWRGRCIFCDTPEAGDATPPATPQNDNMLSMRTHGLCSQSPATPQPETPLADVPHEEVDELVATIYAERRALSPPPDVERLKAYKRGFRDGFAAAQSWGCDMVEEALAAWSPSTPGEPT